MTEDEIKEIIKNSEGPDADGRGWGIQELKLIYGLQKLYKEKKQDILNEFKKRLDNLDKESTEGFKGGTATCRLLLKKIMELNNE